MSTPTPTVLGAELAVSTEEDVLAMMADDVTSPTKAPVRDAIVKALLALLVSVQEAGDYAAAQISIEDATDIYLEGLGSDRDMAPSPLEDDEAFRARLVAVPKLVTPDAIREVVNAILSPFTSTRCQLYDSVLDRWYVGAWRVNGTSNPPWHSFVSAASHPEAGRNPYYPVREPEADHAPGGAVVFADTLGRFFVLRVPDLSALGAITIAPVFTTASGGSPYGFYVGNGTSGVNTSYVWKSSVTALDVYRAIVSSVERMVGASIRWMLIADPKL